MIEASAEPVEINRPKKENQSIVIMVVAVVIIAVRDGYFKYSPRQKLIKTVKGVPRVLEVSSRVRRGASFRRPQADKCSAEGRRHERRTREKKLFAWVTF